LSERDPLLHRLGEAAATLGREPPRHPAVRILIQGGLTVLVLGFLVYTVVGNWSELSEQDVRFAAGWLAPGLLALLAFQHATSWAWVLQLRMLGHSPDSLRTRAAWAKSLLARYVPGGVLFVVTRVLLTEREGVPRRVTITAMAYETGLQFASAAAFAAWLLLAHPDVSDRWLGWLALAAVPLALGAMHPRVFPKIANAAFRTLGRRDIPAVLDVRRLLALFGYYLLTWAVMGIAVFCFTKTIFPVDVSDFGVIASAQALAFCAAVATLVFPGGLGIRDGAFAWALEPAVSSFTVAAAVALTTRIGLTAAEVLYAAGTTSLARRRTEPPYNPPPDAPAAAEIPQETKHVLD
jgi:hypothetical protein